MSINEILAECQAWQDRAEKAEAELEAVKKILLVLAKSHSRLSQAEYNRNQKYNDSHFSAIAEHKLLDYLNEHDKKLLDELLKGGE